LPATLTSFDPSHKVIQRSPTKPKTSEVASSWEPTLGYRTNKGAIFAAKVASWIESFCFIRKKDTKVVPMRFNRIQEILLQFVAWRWSRSLNVKVITPKARQLGSSTFWECLLYALAELVPGFQAAIVAHDDNGVSQLWGKIRTIKNNLYKTGWKDSALVNDADGRAEWQTSSAIFTGLIRSADALGKAGTPNSIHFSEVANFSDKGCDAEAGIASIKSSMSETEWTVEIYESTAKGKDKTFFNRCEEAKSPDSTSTLTLIFLPWYLDEGYTLPWQNWRHQLIASGKNDPGPRLVPTEEESQLRERIKTLKQTPYSYPHLLTDDQLTWRRWALANKCEGKLDVLKRYYPSTYEECFTASADSAFSDETISYYRQLARAPVLRGHLRGKVATEDSTGPVQIWEFPQPHMPYILGGDPGGSLSTSDPYSAYVMNRITRKVVAQIHGHLDWDEFTRLVRDMGYFYNTALLVIENNYNPAIANTLHQWSYPNLYYYYAQSTIEAHTGRVPGFNTNRKTRKELSSLVRTYARERLFDCPDIEITLEMENFVWVPFQSAQNPDMEGDYKAIGGNHDDRIMALALILTQLDALIPSEAQIPIQALSEPKATEAEQAALQWYEKHEEARKEAERKAKRRQVTL
jgi:hypothetical protein